MQISNTLEGKPLQRRRTHKTLKTLPYHKKVNNTRYYTQLCKSHFATSLHLLHDIVQRYQCFGIQHEVVTLHDSKSARELLYSRAIDTVVRADVSSVTGASGTRKRTALLYGPR